MKIAVSTGGADLSSEVDQRFGRCRFFLIVETGTLEFEAVPNEGASGGGAGIAAAKIVVGKGVEAVLTGNCGPNAFNVLEGAGIKLITGVSGNVRQAVEDYAAGKYEVSTQPNAGSHAGMNN